MKEMQKCQFNFLLEPVSVDPRDQIWLAGLAAHSVVLQDVSQQLTTYGTVYIRDLNKVNWAQFLLMATILIDLFSVFKSL